jgi:antitoxin component HigA of HigAB toxin-antitoxin module
VEAALYRPQTGYCPDLGQRDLIPVLGASSVISDILNGKRLTSKTHARKLAEFFHVPVSLFI